MNWKTCIAIIGIASLAQVAAAHDPREKGHDPKEEMVRVPIKVRAAPAAELPRIRFHEMDLNSDRKITRTEWRGKGSAFRKLDRNKDGFLSGSEVEISSKPAGK